MPKYLAVDLANDEILATTDTIPKAIKEINICADNDGIGPDDDIAIAEVIHTLSRRETYEYYLKVPVKQAPSKKRTVRITKPKAKKSNGKGHRETCRFPECGRGFISHRNQHHCSDACRNTMNGQMEYYSKLVVDGPTRNNTAETYRKEHPWLLSPAFAQKVLNRVNRRRFARAKKEAHAKGTTIFKNTPTTS